MAGYRPKGRLTKAYSDAVIEDACMARYLLVEPHRSCSWVEDFAAGPLERTTETETE